MSRSEGPACSDQPVIHVSLDGRVLVVAVAVAVICLLGAAVRLYPLADSPWPNILDGIAEARYADHIALTGTLAPEGGASYSGTHTVYTPAYDAELALLSLITGRSAFDFIQLLVAPIGLALLLGTFALARRLTESSRVGVLTTFALAVYGPFVVITMASWKEAIGLSLLPVALLAFSLREDLRMRIISSGFVLFMPFVHHLVALVLVLTVAFAGAAGVLIARRETRGITSGNFYDCLLAMVAGYEMVLYYTRVKFDRLDYLTPENGLYLFIGLSMLMALSVYYLGSRSLTPIGRRILWAAASAGLVLLIALNIASPIGTIGEGAWYMLGAPLLACIVLMIGALFGITIWSSTARGQGKTLYFALLVAPFTVVLFGLVRGPDLISLDIVARSLDLIDLGAMIGLAVFVAYVVRGSKRRYRYLATCCVCLLLVITLAMAVDTERYLGTRNNIYDFEMDAIGWSAGVATNEKIESDVHYYYARYMFDRPDEATLARRLITGADLQSGTLMIASERWVTVGLKDLPHGWVKLDETGFNDMLQQSNVLYFGGPKGIGVVVLKSPI